MSEAPTHIAIARELRDKFERYAAALTFSTLGLAITTAHFGTSVVAGSLELVSWASLLASGLVALSRLERIATIYETYHNQEIVAERQNAVISLQKVGYDSVIETKDVAATPIAKAVEMANDKVEELAALAAKMERSLVRRYRLHRFLFLAGIITLTVARAYVPATAIYFLIRTRLGY